MNKLHQHRVIATLIVESWYWITLGLALLISLEVVFPTLILSHLPLAPIVALWMLWGWYVCFYSPLRDRPMPFMRTLIVLLGIFTLVLSIAAIW